MYSLESILAPRVLYDEDGNPVSRREGRALDEVLREGKMIPSVEMLARDSKAFEAFIDGLCNLDNEALNSRITTLAGDIYWQDFVYLVHKTKQFRLEKSNAESVLSAARALKSLALKDVVGSYPSSIAFARPVVLLLSQYVLSSYGLSTMEKDIEYHKKLDSLLKRLGKIIFDDEQAFQKDTLGEYMN